MRVIKRLSWFVALLSFAQTSSLYAQKEPNCLGPSNKPLVQAIRDGDLGKAREMVKSGAKLNIEDQCGAIPLHETIRWSYTDFALELLSAGADPKFPDGGAEALIGTAFVCNSKLASKLLKHGVPVNAARTTGETALMEAPSRRCKEGAMVQLLLDAGANPNAKTKNGFNPLLAAAMTGDAIGAEKLLKAGADPKARDDRGHTAEDEACDRGEQGHFLVCQLVRAASRQK
jgi:ankyrin repeat protein